jgi:hypothetical protein
MRRNGYLEEWICYKCPVVSAKRLTVLPGKKVIIKDSAAYGIITVQGKGSFGDHKLETPTLIRYGQPTCDEYFVSYDAAIRGVEIINTSDCEELVILKHFSDNPDFPRNF